MKKTIKSKYIQVVHWNDEFIRTEDGGFDEVFFCRTMVHSHGFLRCQQVSKWHQVPDPREEYGFFLVYRLVSKTSVFAANKRQHLFGAKTKPADLAGFSGW